MTVAEWNALFRDRKSNPVIAAFWRKRQHWISRVLLVTVIAATVLHAALDQPWISASLNLAVWEPLLFLLLAPVLPVLSCLFLWPRLRTGQELEQLLLTRLSRNEVAFGLVWKPLVLSMTVQVPLILHVLLYMVLGQAWDSMFDSRISMVVAQTVLVASMAGIASFATVRAWSTHPDEVVRNIVSLAGRWLLTSAMILLFFFGALGAMRSARYYPQQSFSYGLWQEYRYLIQSFSLAVFCAFAVGVLLRVMKQQPIGRFILVIMAASLLLTISPGFTLRSTGLLQMMPFIVPMAVFLASEFSRFRANLGERVFQAADPETFREADWFACEAAGRDERGRVRSALSHLGATVRAGLDPKLLVGITFLGVGTILASSQLCRLINSTITYEFGTFGSDPADLLLAGHFSIAAFFLIATVLPLMAILDISRIYPDGRIPVLKGGILSTALVYTLGPSAIALLHPFILIIVLPIIQHRIDPGYFIAMGFLTISAFALGLGIVLSLIPIRRRRLWIAAWILFAGGIYYFQIADIGRFYTTDFFFPNYKQSGLISLFLQLFAVSGVFLYGIGYFAQRIFRSEFGLVGRFEFNMNPREVLRLPRFGCLALKRSPKEKM